MFVYECPEAPPSNSRSIYISYLDSVRFLFPAHFRTPIFQEIVVAYLAYCQRQGFNTAHLWVCPPHRGDDYILYLFPPSPTQLLPPAGTAHSQQRPSAAVVQGVTGTCAVGGNRVGRNDPRRRISRGKFPSSHGRFRGYFRPAVL